MFAQRSFHESDQSAFFLGNPFRQASRGHHRYPGFQLLAVKRLVMGILPQVCSVKRALPQECGSPYDPEKAACCEFTIDTVDTVDGLDPGTYYFAATAYDKDGNESAKSEELEHTFSNEKPIPPPTGSLKVTITPSAAVSAGAQWRVVGGINWRIVAIRSLVFRLAVISWNSKRYLAGPSRAIRP